MEQTTLKAVRPGGEKEIMGVRGNYMAMAGYAECISPGFP